VLEEPDLAQAHVDVVEAHRPQRFDLLLRGLRRRGHLEQGRSGKTGDGRVCREARLHARGVADPVDESEAHALAAHVVAVEPLPEESDEIDVHPDVTHRQEELDVPILHAHREVGDVDPSREDRVGAPVGHEHGLRVRADRVPDETRREGEVGDEQVDQFQGDQGDRRDPQHLHRPASHRRVTHLVPGG